MQKNSTASSVRIISDPLPRKVQIVYYLSYGGGILEHPHLLQVCISSSSTAGLCLKDVKKSLASLRGSIMPSCFSWSYKRSYRQGYVWQDLESDNDPIFPTHGGSEYILKGCKIDSSCIVQTSTFPAPQLPGSATSQSVNNVSTSVEPLIMKMAELPSDEKANTNTVESSSSASLHVCEDKLIFSPGIIEGLEHLHPNQKNDLHYEVYAESQASTSLDHINASEQSKASKQESVSQESYIDIKLALKGNTVPYGSQFRNLTENDEPAGASFNSSQYVVMDAATQTVEDENLPIEHTKSKLTCPSKCFNPSHHGLLCPILQGSSSLPSTSREEMMCKQKVSTQNLSRERISPLSNTVVSCKINQRPKLSFHQSAEFSADQMFQEAMIGRLANGDCNDDNPLCRLITSGLSEDFDQESYTDVVDYSCQKSRLTSDSTNMKPNHAIRIFSSSGRFLRLVSCGGGLEVIRPTRTSSNRSDREHGDGCESSLAGAHLPFKHAKSDPPCMRTSLANAQNNPNIFALSSSLPYVASDVLYRGYKSRNNETEFSAQKAKTSNNKKLWHLKGWVNSHYKKIKSTRGEVSKAVPLAL